MNTDPDRQGDDPSPRGTKDQSTDAREVSKYDRAAPLKQPSKSRKRGLQQAELGKVESDDVEKKMMGASSALESAKRSKMISRTGNECLSTGEEDQKHGQSKSIGDDSSSFTSKKGAVSGKATQTSEGKEDRESGDEPNDRVSMLYTENIIAAAAATNNELFASGMASLNVSPHSQGGTVGDRPSLLSEVRDTAVQGGNALDASTLGIVRELVAENSYLRRRNEELLHDLQATRDLISRLLAGVDGTGYAQGGLQQMLGAQLVQPELLNNPFVNLSPMTEVSSAFGNLSALLRQAQFQPGQSASVGSQSHLPETQIRQVQQVASNPWVPMRTFHSQVHQHHRPPHVSSFSPLNAAEQHILLQALSQAAISDNPRLQQYLSTNLAHQLLLVPPQAQRQGPDFSTRSSRRPEEKPRKSKETPKRSDKDHSK
jgi:hypothetical protein